MPGILGVLGRFTNLPVDRGALASAFTTVSLSAAAWMCICAATGQLARYAHAPMGARTQQPHVRRYSCGRSCACRGVTSCCTLNQARSRPQDGWGAANRHMQSRSAAAGKPGVGHLVLRAVLARVDAQRVGLLRQRRLDVAPRAVPGTLARHLPLFAARHRLRGNILRSTPLASMSKLQGASSSVDAALVLLCAQVQSTPLSCAMLPCPSRHRRVPCAASTHNRSRAALHGGAFGCSASTFPIHLPGQAFPVYQFWHCDKHAQCRKAQRTSEQLL